MQRMHKMHEFNDMGENCGEFSATVVATFVEEMQEKENCNIGIDWKRERGS